MPRKISFIALVLLLVGTISAALAGETARVAAPDFKLMDIEGKPHALSALRGKVVLVNFWATWCPPCRREMPSMQRLYESLPHDAFEILAINVGEDENTVQTFSWMLNPAPAFPLLLDRDSTVLRKWPVKGLPSSFVIDKSGKIALRLIGGRDFDSPAVMEQIKPLLEEKR